MNKGRVEEGVEKILPTSGYRFELLTHSDSPPNKYMTLTLLFFLKLGGRFPDRHVFFSSHIKLRTLQVTPTAVQIPVNSLTGPVTLCNS